MKSDSEINAYLSSLWDKAKYIPNVLPNRAHPAEHQLFRFIKNSNVFSKPLIFFYLILATFCQLVRSLLFLLTGFLRRKHFLKLRGGFEVVFVSHYQDSSLSLTDDRFFGWAKTDGVKHLTVFLNHSKATGGFFDQRANAILEPKWYPFDCYLYAYESWANTLRDLWKVFCRENFRANIWLLYLTLRSFSHGYVRQLCRQHWLIEVCGNLSGGQVWMTFEGHAYESLLSSHFKRSSAGVVIVGFQHSFMTRSQVSLLSRFSVDHWDLLICSRRSAMLNLVAICPQLAPKLISTEGSMFSRELRDEVIDPVQPSSHETSCSIVAVSEAYATETILLFLACVILSRSCPAVLQLHPDCPKFISNLLASFSILSPNLRLKVGGEISIKPHGVVLYRGSTAVFEHVISGSFPLKLKIRADEVENDPLDFLGGAVDSICLFEIFRVKNLWIHSASSGNFSKECARDVFNRDAIKLLSDVRPTVLKYRREFGRRLVVARKGLMQISC